MVLHSTILESPRVLGLRIGSGTQLLSYKSSVTTRVCNDRLLADVRLVLEVLHRDAWLGWLRLPDREVDREDRCPLEDLGSFMPSC